MGNNTPYLGRSRVPFLDSTTPTFVPRKTCASLAMILMDQGEIQNLFFVSCHCGFVGIVNILTLCMTPYEHITSCHFISSLFTDSHPTNSCQTKDELHF